MTAASWVWARFRADEDDPRPITVPAPGPWWCTGYGDGYSIVVVYLRPGQDVTTWWPEASHIDIQDVDGIAFSDRFPCPDWWDADRQEHRTQPAEPVAAQGDQS